MLKSIQSDKVSVLSHFISKMLIFPHPWRHFQNEYHIYTSTITIFALRNSQNDQRYQWGCSILKFPENWSYCTNMWHKWHIVAQYWFEKEIYKNLTVKDHGTFGGMHSIMWHISGTTLLHHIPSIQNSHITSNRPLGVMEIISKS